jgi:hypothetical protein
MMHAPARFDARAGDLGRTGVAYRFFRFAKRVLFSFARPGGK